MPAVVSIQKRKRPVGTGTWLAYELGSDTFGRWLFTPAHSVYTGHDGTRASTCEVSQSSPGGPGRDSVVLMPLDGWWVATWVDGAFLHCSADIATPPVLDAGGWWFDDLELDPYLVRGGDYGVEDEDEFDEAYAAGLITSAERSAALDAVTELRALFVRGGPLVTTGDAWLAHGSALALPALRAEAPPAS